MEFKAILYDINKYRLYYIIISPIPNFLPLDLHFLLPYNVHKPY